MIHGKFLNKWLDLFIDRQAARIVCSDYLVNYRATAANIAAVFCLSEDEVRIIINLLVSRGMVETTTTNSGRTAYTISKQIRK